MDDEIVILNTKNGVYYSLNSVGGFIWEVLKEPKRLEVIVENVLQEYDVEYQQCKEDVLHIVQEMIKEGIAEISDDKNR
ncbi:MAG: PqqD family peptide modification chaperone [Thermodesulfovibrionales bacterium]